jgi:CYTH domain-containing protein
VEIERKFLVERPPADLDPAAARHIEQGYLALDEQSGAEVRLRRHGEELSLTVKGAGQLARVEEEFEPSAEQFESLWPLTEGRRIQKLRHELPAGELTIELDVYEGALEGLAVAEVEFPSEDASRAFEPPSWFGRELTDDARYRNRALAVDGRPSD